MGSGDYAPSEGAGSKDLGGGKAAQKLEYECILCNGKSVFVNTRFQVERVNIR